MYYARKLREWYGLTKYIKEDSVERSFRKEINIDNNRNIRLDTKRKKHTMTGILNVMSRKEELEGKI